MNQKMTMVNHYMFKVKTVTGGGIRQKSDSVKNSSIVNARKLFAQIGIVNLKERARKGSLARTKPCHPMREENMKWKLKATEKHFITI